MSKAFRRWAIGALVGGIAIAIGLTTWPNSCVRLPDGSFSLSMLEDSVARLVGAPKAQCDPFEHVEVKSSVAKVTVITSSAWSALPRRYIAVSNDGSLKVLLSDASKRELPGRVEFQKTDLSVSRRVLQSIEPLIAYNHVNFERKLHDSNERGMEAILDDPKIACSGYGFDAGSITIEWVLMDGTDGISFFDRNCVSPSAESASRRVELAREAVFTATAVPKDEYGYFIEVPDQTNANTSRN